MSFSLHCEQEQNAQREASPVRTRASHIGEFNLVLLLAKTAKSPFGEMYCEQRRRRRARSSLARTSLAASLSNGSHGGTGGEQA